jgi:hypothetical protein
MSSTAGDSLGNTSLTDGSSETSAMVFTSGRRRRTSSARDVAQSIRFGP